MKSVSFYLFFYLEGRGTAEMDLQTHKKGENVPHTHNKGVAERWDNSLNERMTIQHP